MKIYFPQIGKRNGEKYLVSRILGREMEKFYPFPDEKFGKKSISLPVSCGKQDSRPSLCHSDQTKAIKDHDDHDDHL